MIFLVVMRVVSRCVGVVGQLVGVAGQEDPVVDIVDANAALEKHDTRKICCRVAQGDDVMSAHVSWAWLPCALRDVPGR